VNILSILQLINGLMSLAGSIGLNVIQYKQMIAASPDGTITDEQIAQLVKQRNEAIANL